jgi:hypothetical protein
MAVFTALSIAVATYGVSAGLAGAAMAGLGYLATTFTGQLLLSLGVNALLGALSPKPAAAAQRGYETNVLGAALDHTIIYGKTKVGGAVVYNEATGTDNKFLHRVIAVAGHEMLTLTLVTLVHQVTSQLSLTLTALPLIVTTTNYKSKLLMVHLLKKLTMTL